MNTPAEQIHPKASDSRPKKREKFAEKLADWRQNTEFYSLCALLQDEVHDVQLAAATSLRSCAAQIPQQWETYRDAEQPSRPRWGYYYHSWYSNFRWRRRQEIQPVHLAWSEQREHIIQTLESILPSSSVEVALSAIQTLGSLQSWSSTPLILERAHASRDPACQRSACIILAEKGGSEVAEFMGYVLESQDERTVHFALCALAYISAHGKEGCETSFSLLKKSCYRQEDRSAQIAKELCAYLEAEENESSADDDGVNLIHAMLSSTSLSDTSVQQYLQKDERVSHQKVPSRRHKRRGKGKARRVAFQQERYHARENTSSLAEQAEQEYGEDEIVEYENYDIWDDPYNDGYVGSYGYSGGNSGPVSRWFEANVSAWYVKQYYTGSLDDNLKAFKEDSRRRMSGLVALLLRNAQHLLSEELLRPFFESLDFQEIECALVALVGLDERLVLSWTQFALSRGSYGHHRAIIRVLSQCQSDEAMEMLASLLLRVETVDQKHILAALCCFGERIESIFPQLIAFRESLSKGDELDDECDHGYRLWGAYISLLAVGASESLKELEYLHKHKDVHLQDIHESIGLLGGWSSERLSLLTRIDTPEAFSKAVEEHPNHRHVVARFGVDSPTCAFALASLLTDFAGLLESVKDRIQHRTHYRQRDWYWSMGWLFGEACEDSLFSPDRYYYYDEVQSDYCEWVANFHHLQRSLEPILTHLFPSEESVEGAGEVDEYKESLRALLNRECSVLKERLQNVMELEKHLLTWEVRCFAMVAFAVDGWLMQLQGKTLLSWQEQLEGSLFEM